VLLGSLAGLIRRDFHYYRDGLMPLPAVRERNVPSVPTPAERQALLFVAAVAALGIGVRAWRAIDRPSADLTARGSLAAQIAQVDSAIARGGASRQERAAQGGSPSGSRFGSRLGSPSGSPSGSRSGEGARIRSGARSPSRPGGAPGGEMSSPYASPSPPVANEPTGPVDVDLATLEELERLPGIGPALAARIVEDRERNGPFGSLAGLDRVKGIGPALAERLRPHVTFSLSPRPPDTEVPAAQATRRGRRP
jgi:competence protein ComEA